MIIKEIKKKVRLDIFEFFRNTVRIFEKRGYSADEKSFERKVLFTGEGEKILYSFEYLMEKEIPTRKGEEWKFSVKVYGKFEGIPKENINILEGNLSMKFVGGVEHKKGDTTISHNIFVLIMNRLFGKKPEEIFSEVQEKFKKEMKDILKEIKGML